MDVEKPRAETPRDAKEPADEDLYTRLKELQRELELWRSRRSTSRMNRRI